MELIKESNGHELFEYFSQNTQHQETTEHTIRCVQLAKEFGTYMGLSDKELKQLEDGLFIHDLGKYYIAPTLLYANRRLTDDEFKIIKNHPMKPFKTLNKSLELQDTVAVRIMLEHHERIDGNGYPNQLQGDQIHFLSKIASIVDVYDALANPRSYKDAWSLERILQLLNDGAGTHFDSDLVSKFIGFIFEQKG